MTVAANRSGAIAVVAVPVAAIGLVLSIVLLGSSDSAAAICNPAGGPQSAVTIDPATVPETTVAGYGHEQLVNAAHVIQAGKDLGLGVRDQTIGVMTAMGESGLRVLDHGDGAGPDSRGLFQQRDNGAWGSYADRMDPYISATNFFTAMMGIAERDSLEPTIVAHRTQRNADPFHYAKYWDAAVQVVEALAGVDTGLSPGTGNQVCAGKGTTPGTVNPAGWAAPGAGPVRSGFGQRTDPVSGAFTRLHAGTDLQAGGCGGPIWAAQAGTVIYAGMRANGTGTIELDHGGGLTTRYLHMYADGILVQVGDAVTVGQQIGRTGSSGNSTGCHLHYEVLIDGQPTDPEPFMQDLGITLGS